MNLIFISDHPFYEENGLFYSQGNLPKYIWSRYLIHFNSMLIVGRKILTKKDNLVLSSTEKVKFHLLKIYKRPYDELLRRKQIDSILLDLISQSDAAIIRLPSIIGFRSIKICRKIRKPYAIEVVGCPKDTYWYYGNIAGKILSPYVFLRMKKAVRNSRYSLYVTKCFLQRRYPSSGKTEYASNVEIGNIDNNVLLNHKNKLIEDKTVLKFGMIGNINVKYKGFKTAFKALSIIKNDIPFFRLQLVGGGDSHWIISLAKRYNLLENIEIMGILHSGDQIFNFLDSLDMYLHPSKTEGLPRAVIEAMSRACPILSSSVGGIPELLDNKYLHYPGDYKSLSQHIKKYIRNKESLLEMAENNFIKSKEYSSNILNEKRNAFWSQFKNFAINS